MAEKNCRRCSECQGRTHHWMPNSDFGDEEAPLEVQDAEWVCKHCEALGEDCRTCHGSGFEPGVDDEEACSACDGEGVRECPGFGFHRVTHG